MPATTIVLVRHGETDWNRDGRIQGQADVPLNERGRAQARELAAQLNGLTVDAVYASDLSRARETAEILAANLGLPVVVDPDLRELDFGSWEGLTAEEVRERWPDEFERWRNDAEYTFAGGEAHAALLERVESAVQRLASVHQGGQILLVAHGGPLRALLMTAEGLDYLHDRRSYPPIENCALARIAVEDGALQRPG